MANKEQSLWRVGMLVHSYYPGDSRVRRLAEGLTRGGIEVHVVCLRNAEEGRGFVEDSFETANGVQIHRLPFSRKRGTFLRYLFEYLVTMIWGAWKLTLLHLRTRFDVVHVHNMPDILIMSALIPRLTGARVVLDVHDPMSELYEANYYADKSSLFMKLLRFEEQFCYRIADYLVTVSSTMRESIAKKSRRPLEEIEILHNFPESKLFDISQENRDWPHNKNKFLLLYMGTVTEHYRLDLAVRAVAVVAERFRDIQLLILGEGNRVENVLNLAKELNVADRVHYFKTINVDKLKEVIKSSDVGISTHEGGAFGYLYFSNKILEFMTQGLPVISSRTFTLEKYIPEDAIFYIEPGSVEDLVEKIIWMRKNAEMVKSRIQNARKLVREYMWEKEEHRLLSVYRKFLERR